MANTTLEKSTPETGAVEARPEAQVGKLHKGPVARLLAKVSKLGGEYAEYQMEHCLSRKWTI